jgi:AcrR family transcriptional regulator
VEEAAVVMTDESLIVAQALLRDGLLTVKEVAKQLGVSEPTLYKYLPSPRSRIVAAA